MIKLLSFSDLIPRKVLTPPSVMHKQITRIEVERASEIGAGFSLGYFYVVVSCGSATVQIMQSAIRKLSGDTAKPH